MIIEKRLITVFTIILGNAFPDVSAQAEVVNEERNIFD